MNGSHMDERDRLASQLEAYNKKIELVEYNLYEKQVKLWRASEGIVDPDDYGIVLNNSNKAFDVIRAQLEFGKIYTTLVKANKHTDDTHLMLSKMYDGMLNVTKCVAKK
jgi:hypothetical protein